MLDALGLDELSEKVYRTVVVRSEITEAELGVLLDVDGCQLRAVLDKLRELSLIRDADAGLGMVRAVSPEVGLRSLLVRQQTELLSRQHKLERCYATMADLIEEYSSLAESGQRDTGRAGTQVEWIEGREYTYDRLFELTRGVKHELVSFNCDVRRSAGYLQVCQSLDLELIQRGVMVQMVFAHSVRNHRPVADYAQWFSDHGGRVRTVPFLPMPMVLLDRSIAVLPADAERSDEVSVVVRNPGIVAALCALFDQTWRSAHDYGGAELPDDNGITSQESELLRMLAQGLTDEVVAKRLGISVRTACRLTADLMRRLSARSRFQAGVYASRRGWITD